MVKPDTWIRTMSLDHGMIEPFAEGVSRSGKISYGLSSYGYDMRISNQFKLFSDTNGIYITGKTPLAVRHGAFTVLEKLGFRWFFKHPAWWVVPDMLISLEGLNEVQEPGYFR